MTVMDSWKYYIYYTGYKLSYCTFFGDELVVASVWCSSLGGKRSLPLSVMKFSLMKSSS